MSKHIAIIPARGGSKRLPQKNILDLDGIPLIAHSINFAKKETCIDEIWVSTDSERIADISKNYGANILIRPDYLAGDYISTNKVIKHHANFLLKKDSNIEWISILQPTNPIRPAELISKAFNKMINEGRNALACFSPMEKKFGKIQNDFFYPESYHFGQRGQDIENRYYENGLLYIVKSELAANGQLMPNNLYPYIIDSLHGTVDIDIKIDLEYAKVIIDFYKKTNTNQV